MNHLITQEQSPTLYKTEQQLHQQQKTLHFSNLISAFEDPSIKKLQQYNKNKLQRQLLDIASNFYSIIDKIDMIKWFCIDYKTTLQSYRKQQIQALKNKEKLQEQEAQNDLKSFNKQQKMIDESLQSNIPLFFQQQLNTNQRTVSNINPNQPNMMPIQQNPKPLVVLPAKRLQTKHQQIQSVINKLKVMVVKVNTKQSTSFQYVYSTYISRLRYVQIKYIIAIQDVQNKKYTELFTEEICDIENRVKKYISLSSNEIPQYIKDVFHELVYYRYLDKLWIGSQQKELPMFFINFYVQQLLFFNHEPIKLKMNFSQLLYCPIILIKGINQNKKGKTNQSLQISQWYYEQLNMIQPLWRNSLLLIKVYNNQTSLKYPIYYSHIAIKKFQFPNQLKNSFDQLSHSTFNFMQHKYSKQQAFLSDLQTIKQFIYQTLIFNYLFKILNKSIKNQSSNKVHINIEGGFKIQFQLVADLQVKQTLKNSLNLKTNNQKKAFYALFDLPQKHNQLIQQPVYKSEFISDLLLFFKRKNLFTLRKIQLIQQLQILFKSTLFKVITQHLQYRTVSPAYAGSISLYYYEKKTIRKNSVNNFLKNFGPK